MRRFCRITALVLSVIISVMACNIVSGAEIGVYMDGSKIQFGTAAPVIKNGRIIAPVKIVFESIGADVRWVAEERKVVIKQSDTTIELVIGSKIVTVKSGDKDRRFESDVAPEIINGSTYVPLGIVAESLGAGVVWKGEEHSAYITFISPLINEAVDTPFAISVGGNKVSIDDTAKTIKSEFGGYVSQNQSVYPYVWQNFTADAPNCVFIGVSGEKAVAFYSNSKNASLGGIRPGMSADELNIAVGKVFPMESKSVITNEKGTITIYRSMPDDYSVLAVMVQKTGFTTAIPEISNDFFNESAEAQLFSIINCARLNSGQKALQNNDALAKVARDHSVSMASGNYLSHTSADGKNAFDRLNQNDISDYGMASENIGRDCIDAIEIYFTWMNSKIDAANVVAPNYTTIGIGAANSTGHKLYFTADFIEQ